MRKKLTKVERIEIHGKYAGHCAYCGKEIEYKDMQVDHIIPQRNYWHYLGQDEEEIINSMDNFNPSCRRCNHYKRANSLGTFREMLKTLHERLRKQYLDKVAEDYGIIKIEPWDGRFYFERVEVENE